MTGLVPTFVLMATRHVVRTVPPDLGAPERRAGGIVAWCHAESYLDRSVQFVTEIRRTLAPLGGEYDDAVPFCKACLDALGKK